jgi:hypothetical protein
LKGFCSLLFGTGVGKSVHFHFTSFVSSPFPQMDLWLRFDSIIHVYRKSNIGMSTSSSSDLILVTIVEFLFDLVNKALDLPPNWTRYRFRTVVEIAGTPRE